VYRPAALLVVSVLSGCVPAGRPGGDRQKPSAVPAHRPTLAQVNLARELAETPDPAPGLPLTAPFTDDFEREALGGDYFATSDRYQLARGRLCVSGAHNHPLWLRRRLPPNARISVEAESESSDGDIKLEAWGDGLTAPSGATYTDATSYLAIFGGWKNHYHVLARLNEHAEDRTQTVIEPGSDDPRQLPVVKGRRYRFRLERSDGRTVRFWVDDVEILSMSDPHPLAGVGHDHFAFNDWETPVCFDHLLVEPLPG
jgi:hypothetical protein